MESWLINSFLVKKLRKSFIFMVEAMWILKKNLTFLVSSLLEKIYFFTKKNVSWNLFSNESSEVFLWISQKIKFWEKKNLLTSKNVKMSSGFTHEENVLKATCSFESETLFTRTAEKIIWLICF